MHPAASSHGTRDKEVCSEGASESIIDAIRREYVYMLQSAHTRLAALFRAVYGHGVMLENPMLEVMREKLATMCDYWLERLTPLMAEAREHVGIPKAILDEPGTPDECHGEDWEWVWEPMLVRGERWLVTTLARIGLPVVDPIDGFPEIERAYQKWDAEIEKVSAANRAATERLIARAKSRVSEWEKLAPRQTPDDG
jgi:hypothetical protein